MFVIIFIHTRQTPIASQFTNLLNAKPYELIARPFRFKYDVRKHLENSVDMDCVFLVGVTMQNDIVLDAIPKSTGYSVCTQSRKGTLIGMCKVRMYRVGTFQIHCPI